MTVKRDKNGKFLPGNPGGGRPKIPDDVKEATRAACPKAVAVPVALLDSKKELVRMDAAKILLERGYGKPVQMQDISLDMAGSVDVTAQIRRVLLEAENDGRENEAGD